jgi:two-component system sensor histidine kinase DesK
VSMLGVGVAADRLTDSRPRWPRWLVIAVHVVFFVSLSFYAGAQLHQELPWPPNWGGIPLTLLLGLALLALQLRLSLAFAAGERRSSAPWLLLAEAVVVYLPIGWLGWSGYWAWSWFFMQACLVAAAPMVLPRRPAVAVAVAVIAASSLINAGVGGVVPRGTFTVGPAAAVIVFWVVYTIVELLLPAAGLYGSARLVRLIEALRETRAELAALAVGRERLRAARDLHDLLGQSLSAISLKGDLAIRLLGSDPGAARGEIESLGRLARDAAHGIRAVSRDEHVVSLHEEAQGAAALLAAAGIQTRVDLDLPELPPDVERLLGWAVREGVTNALRHSQARSCSICGRRQDRRVVLEVVNDGVSGPAGHGSGLAGLAERARTLGGSVSAGGVGGEFRLVVAVAGGAA